MKYNIQSIALLLTSCLLSCSSKIDFDIPLPDDSGNNATELLITEIATAINTDASHGGSRNHYVEIFNGTGTSVNLNDYAIGYQATTDLTTLDGWSFPEGNYLLLSGTLTDRQCYVIASPQADQTFVPGDTTWGTTSTAAANAGTPLQLSGNSAIALLKKDDAGILQIEGEKYSVIDVFGSPLVERITATGSSSARNNFIWPVAGETDTRNRTFWRKNTIKSPTADWQTSMGTTPLNGEWELSEDRNWDYTDVGKHTIN